MNDLVNGNVSLEVIQIGIYTSDIKNKNSLPNEIIDDLIEVYKNTSVNIIFKSKDIYYSVIVDLPLFNKKNNVGVSVKSINIQTKIPLKSSDENIQQMLQLCIN